MPRRRRPYMPGAIFHLTARTQGKEHWFDAAMRDFIHEAMAHVQRQTDAKLRAYAIMSNHLHVLLQQGLAPISAFMQPLLCRTALAVKRKYGVDGHVFSRRFWDGVCVDEAQVFAVVDYIHGNPVRAGLCAELTAWPWTSHASYAHPHTPRLPLVEPISDAASFCFFPNSDAALPTQAPALTKLDLRDLLMLALRQSIADDDLTLNDLRCMRGRTASQIRRRLIRRAAEAGYRGSLIANALGVSESMVSKVVRAGNICRPRLWDFGAKVQMERVVRKK